MRPQKSRYVYKIDLDFIDCFGREKSIKIKAEFHETDLDICDHSRERNSHVITDHYSDKISVLWLTDISYVILRVINPIGLRKAKIVYNFGCSEFNRVTVQELSYIFTHASHSLPLLQCCFPVLYIIHVIIESGLCSDMHNINFSCCDLQKCDKRK